jgi:hypothetical protein
MISVQSDFRPGLTPQPLTRSPYRSCADNERRDVRLPGKRSSLARGAIAGIWGLTKNIEPLVRHGEHSPLIPVETFNTFNHPQWAVIILFLAL